MCTVYLVRDTWYVIPGTRYGGRWMVHHDGAGHGIAWHVVAGELRARILRIFAVGGRAIHVLGVGGGREVARDVHSVVQCGTRLPQ